jgi:hypothetical protein
LTMQERQNAKDGADSAPTADNKRARNRIGLPLYLQATNSCSAPGNLSPAFGRKYESKNWVASSRAQGEPTFVGEHLVVDPRVCHGEVTFRGTRVPVETILAKGYT